MLNNCFEHQQYKTNQHKTEKNSSIKTVTNSEKKMMKSLEAQHVMNEKKL